MPFTSIIYAFFVLSATATTILIHPMIGVLSYIAVYNIGSVNKWWGELLYNYGIRDSQFIYIAIVISFFVQNSKLHVRLFDIDRHEILLTTYLLIAWLSTVIGLDNGGDYYNVIKITKVIIILFFISRIITSMERFTCAMWALVLSALLMGFNAYFADDWMFAGNRLDAGIGGADFANSNYLAAHLVMVIPLTIALFLKSKIFGRLICTANIILIMNTLVLLRTRGAFIAITVALLVSLIFADRRYYKYLLFGSLLFVIGFVSLTDNYYWQRISTITADEQDRDQSAQGRLELWSIALKMAMDHPLGVGVDNYKKYMADYGALEANRDTHSTYFKCLSELGIHGLAIFLLLIINSYSILIKIKNIASTDNQYDDYKFISYVLIISLTAYLVSCLFMSANYVENLYWVFMWPLFLKRSFERIIIQKDLGLAGHLNSDNGNRAVASQAC